MFKENPEFRNFYSAGRVPAIDVQVFFSTQIQMDGDSLFMYISAFYVIWCVGVGGADVGVVVSYRHISFPDG